MATDKLNIAFLECSLNESLLDSSDELQVTIIEATPKENLRSSTPIHELEIDDSIDTICDLTVIEKADIGDVGDEQKQ